jgi:hypothetical protein
MGPINFKLIIVASFAPNREAGPPLKIEKGKLEDAMAQLQPAVGVDPLDDPIVFKTLEDFSPEALKANHLALASSSDQLTKVLHDKDFQAIESAWRGLALTESFLPDEGAELYILNSPFSELRERFYNAVFMPEYNQTTDTPLGLTLLDFDFDHTAAKLDVLKEMGKMAEVLQAPAVGQTTASLFGVSNLLLLPAMNDPFDRLQTAQYASFNSFREQETSRWAGLTLNQFLLRSPYAGETYAEPVAASKPETYLWGRGIWILGANVLRSIAEHKHPGMISGMGTGGEMKGLPTRVLPVTRTEKITTPLEASLPIEVFEALPYLGISPLTQLPADLGGQQQPDNVFFHLAANLRHFPDPQGQKRGRLLSYSTLAYSMLLGWIANLSLRLLPELKGLGSDGAAETLKKALGEHIVGEGELSVEAQDGVLVIDLVPEMLLHGKPFEIHLELPME